jgi:cysteine desulfuration protein SufE
MAIEPKVTALVDEFARLPDWEARYKRIIALAKALAPMPEAHKSDQNKVRGCSSTVWLAAGMRDGTVVYLADSDALLVKGLVKLLVDVYSGETPADILAHQPTFVEQLGLNANLSPNRASGVGAMIKQIKSYALAFQVMQQRGMTPPTV